MNVILIILDSWRKDHVGAYGNDRIHTPSLDALAKESLSFTRAYPESIPTIPARRAIHTGLRTWPFRNWDPPEWDVIQLYGWQPIPEDQTTLAEILQAEGYHTALVTDTQHQFKPAYNFHRGFNMFDFIRGQERDFYKPHWLAEDKLDQCLLGGAHRFKQESIMQQYFANTAGRKTEANWFAPKVFTRATEVLEGASKGQPFFLVVDCFDPHEPWDPPQHYVDLYDAADYDGPEPMITSYGDTGYLTERQLERMRALYAGEVTMTDRWLGYFLDKIDSLGLRENTLLIVLSDHGHALGEHGVAGKLTTAIYPELTDVPFFIRHPEGKGASKTSDYYASTHDVAPTVLGTLDIEIPDPMDGQDLTVLLDGADPEARDHFTLGYHDHTWARDERYVMFARNDGTEARLYDVQEDPGMYEDIAGSHQKVVNRIWNDYVLKDAGGPLPRY
jgi:arylsulfatase A-like enzyme